MQARREINDLIAELYVGRQLPADPFELTTDDLL